MSATIICPDCGKYRLKPPDDGKTYRCPHLSCRDAQERKDAREAVDRAYIDIADAKRFQWWANDSTFGIDYWREVIDKAMAEESEAK